MRLWFGKREWWKRAGLEPASPACKAGALPIELSSHRRSARRLELVPGVGFEPTSPRFQRGAVTRSASQAKRELVRTRRIELLSPEWRSSIEPINYIRRIFREELVRPRGFEPLVGRPACFMRRRFYRPVAGEGRMTNGGR